MTWMGFSSQETQEPNPDDFMKGKYFSGTHFLNFPFSVWTICAGELLNQLALVPTDVALR